MNIFKKLVLKSTYTSVYGSNASINITNDNVEVIIGNKKIVHDIVNSNKKEETIYDDKSIRIIKYDDSGLSIVEELYIDGEKVYEKDLKTNKVVFSNVETDVESSILSNEEFATSVEKKYQYTNPLTGNDIEVVTNKENGRVLTIINEKKNNEVVLKVEKKSFEDGRLISYKHDFLSVNVSYYGDTRKVKSYSKYIEKPIFEKIDESKKKKSSETSEKQIGVEIIKEIIEFNEMGYIVSVENNDEIIKREFREDGTLKSQYNIITTTNGTEIVGKVLTENNDLKIINNSSMSNTDVMKKNDDMDKIALRYEDNILMFFGFITFGEEVIIVEDYCLINDSFTLKERKYDRLEDDVLYRVEEGFVRNKVSKTRKINQTSKNEFVLEGSKRFVKGLDGIEKDVTQEEFDLYMIADKMNKMPVENKDESNNKKS